MRKFVYISGALFSSITLLSFLFKLLQLQGAQTLLITGFMGIALIYIPLYAIYKYNKNKQK
ncbi:hypothetical protein DHD80_17055 [Gramella sp. AN32]|nr:hypothetical protein [Gramella sp. AN32]